MTDNQQPSLITITGPTCVGKTGTGIALAEAVSGEIISADAMQVYRYMDIGTAKPTEEEQARVPHHLIDVVDPDEAFDAGRFRRMADEVVRGLHKRGRCIFVVGGTGLYIKALTRGLFKAQEGDATVRKRLETEVHTGGSRALHDRLQRVDSVAASRIHPNDSYRIVRALEVFEITGKPLSDQQYAHSFLDTPYRVLKIGLFTDRQLLYDRINERVERMIVLGFLEEVKALLDRGYGPDLKSMQSIGYRHIIQYFQGRRTWDETVELLKRDTRHYAKRQLTWFRGDPEVLWFQPEQRDEIRKKIDSFLTSEVARTTP